MTTTVEWRKWNAMQTKPVTNADRIRSMTDEELAEFLDETDPVCWGREKWLDWLRQEASWEDVSDGILR